MELPMRKTLIVLLLASVALGGCGRIRSSWVNPFNWFGGGATEVAQVKADQTKADHLPVVQDDRGLIERVTEVHFDRYPGGLIVRATGVSRDQGWSDAELVARPLDEQGVQVYEFRALAPVDATDIGPARSREITAAKSISNYNLEAIRRIVVQGESNAMGSNR
jgi:hypothetical protein